MMCLRLFAPWLMVGLSIGCTSQRDLEPSTRSDTKTAETAAPEDGRPDNRAGRAGKLAEDDITREAQRLNRENPPRDPVRTGSVTPSDFAPEVRKTATGYHANLLSKRYGHFEQLVATPAFYRGKIYAGHLDGFEMHAVHAASGELAWSARLSDHGPTAPACADGVCVFNTHSCTLFSLDAATGRELWSWWLGDPQLATPVIADGVVYTSYPGSNAGLRGERVVPYVIGAFDLRTGERLWLSWIDARVNATPVAHNGRIYVATLNGTLYELGAKDGTVLSARRGRVASAPVVAVGGLYFGRDGTRRENNMLKSAHVMFPGLEEKAALHEVVQRPRPVVAEGRLITLERGVIRAHRRGSGRQLWQHRLSEFAPAAIPAPMLYAGGSILVATETGGVVRMDAGTGEKLAFYELSGGALAAQPIVHAGWIYAGTRDGKLIAYDTGAPELTGWEMLGGGADRRGVVDDT